MQLISLDTIRTMYVPSTSVDTSTVALPVSAEIVCLPTHLTFRQCLTVASETSLNIWWRCAESSLKSTAARMRRWIELPLVTQRSFSGSTDF